jgi:hypothetical protein
MQSMNERERMAAYMAFYLYGMKLSVIPVGLDKKPIITNWRPYQEKRAGLREAMGWPLANIAVCTGSLSNLVVVDCESADDARWAWNTLGETPALVKTRRGFHLWFRHPGVPVANGVRVQERYDVRGDGGYVLLPPSVHTDGVYEWIKGPVPTSELPPFRMEWRNVNKPETSDESFGSPPIRDGIAYIHTIRAIAGQRGHDETWRAVQRLKDSGLSESEALYAMCEWNKTNAEPPWTTKELIHKVRDCYRGRRP